MDKRKEKYPDMEKLRKLSIGDLIAVYNSKEEAVQHTRQQLFKDMQSDIAKLYRGLNTSSRKIINGLIAKLTDNEEHQGFNLNVFLYWMELNGVEVADLATYFLDTNEKDIIYSSDDNLNNVQRAKLKPAEIKRRIEYFFGSKQYREKSKSGKSGLTYVKALSNAVLFDPALVLNGHGTMELVKPEVLEEYDKSPDFYLDGRDAETGALCETIRTELENFAEYIDKSWDEIVDTKYGVINYTYGYRFFEESKDDSKKKIVDYMIRQLYSLQKKYENTIRTQQEKHDTELQQLYASILETGIRKGDFGAIAKLNDMLNRQ